MHICAMLLTESILEVDFVLSGANTRASQSGLSRISDSGEGRESEKGVETKEDRPAGKELSTEERLSPEMNGIQPLVEDERH